MDKMPTPTSPAPPVEAAVTLDESIAAIQRGNPKARELTGLSDLGRAAARALGDVWPTFPEARRVAVLRQLDELAESNVQYQFGRVYRIALSDDSAVARQLAVAALWEDTGVDLVDRLLAMLESDPSTDVRAAAATALGHFAERAALGELDEGAGTRIEAALRNVVSTPGEAGLVRRKALEQVVVFGIAGESETFIRNAYDSEDATERISAIFAMGRSLDRRWLPIVVAEFESDDPEVRYEAARASGELGHVDAVQGLSSLVIDEDQEVALAAVIALGKIGGQGAIRVLRSLRDAGDFPHTEALDDALAEADLGQEASRTPA
jgi:HEAT repeat protein